MISIDKLHSYLNKHDASDKERDYVFKIPEVKMADGHIYGRYVIDGKFAFLGKNIIDVPDWTGLDSEYQQLQDKISFKKNSFVIAILNQVMPEFRYFEAKSRINFARDLMRQIAFDMEEKSLYREMEYTRQRNNIRSIFTNFEDIDSEDIMKKIIVDYFSLTVYVLRKESKEIFGKKRIVEKMSFVPGVWKKTERDFEYSIKNPSCILIEEEGRYTSILKKDLSGLFSWQDEGMEELFVELSNEAKKGEKKKDKDDKKDEIVVKEGKLEKSKLITKKDDGLDVEIVEDKKEVIRKKIVKDKVVDKKEKEVTTDKESSIEETKECEETVKEVEKPTKIDIPKKITLTEIQAVAEKEGISITKKSEKTGKDLKKTIQELREDILKKYGVDE